MDAKVKRIENFEKFVQCLDPYTFGELLSKEPIYKFEKGFGGVCCSVCCLSKTGTRVLKEFYQKFEQYGEVELYESNYGSTMFIGEIHLLDLETVKKLIAKMREIIKSEKGIGRA